MAKPFGTGSTAVGTGEPTPAPYLVELVRQRGHQPTRDYVERRRKEGKSKSEIIRCLKRYVGREVFAVLKDTDQKTWRRWLDISRNFDSLGHDLVTGGGASTS